MIDKFEFAMPGWFMDRLSRKGFGRVETIYIGKRPKCLRVYRKLEKEQHMDQNSWVESPRVEQYKFKRGEPLVGKLLTVEPVEIEDDKTHELKSVNQVVVETVVDGQLKRFSFFETADMKRRIPAENAGELIRITYQGDSDTVGRDKGNAMQLFAIAFKPIPKAAS